MTPRRQALRSPEPLATSVFLALILVLSFALPSILPRAELVSSRTKAERIAPDAMSTVVLLLQGEHDSLVGAPGLATEVIMAIKGKAEDANQRMGIVALVLAMLSALTFIVWRYHRREYASPRRNGRRI